jgi:cell division protein FtsL
MYRLGFKQDVLAPTGSLERLVELSGISLDRIVPTLWELTPYSFLADYFVNLGDILSAAVQSTVGVVWTNHTDRQLTISSWRGNWRVRTNYANPRWVNLGFKQISDFRELQHRTVTRYVDTVGSLNSIPLVFTIPGIDSTKWINMGALLWQHSGVRF